MATVKTEVPPSDDCNSVIYYLEALAVGVQVSHHLDVAVGLVYRNRLAVHLLAGETHVVQARDDPGLRPGALRGLVVHRPGKIGYVVLAAKDAFEPGRRYKI